MSRRGCDQGHERPSALWRDLQLDIDRYLGESLGAAWSGRGWGKRLSAFLMPQILCLFLHRFSHLLHVNAWTRSARAVGLLNLLLHRATITPASCIGGGFYLPHPTGVVVHGRAGRGLVIYSYGLCTCDGPALDRALDDGPSLGDQVVIGVHASVIGPVSIGSNTRVAFRTDLAAEAPSNAIVASRSLRAGVKEGAGP